MESPPPSDTGRPAIPIRHNQPNTPPSTHYIRPEQVARKIEAKFDNLLKDADVFFANKRPGYLEPNGRTAEEFCATKPC